MESQARLWAVAFAASALVNLAGLAVMAFWVLGRVAFDPVQPVPAATGEAVAVIRAEMISDGAPTVAGAEVSVASEPPPPPPPEQFARTSPDQEEAVPERADFLGERNTRATSDAPPVRDAPEQPGQEGAEALADEIGTTESRYQDGELPSARQQSEGEISQASAPATEASGGRPDTPGPMLREGAADSQSLRPESPRERLAEGTLPVERRVEGEELAEPEAATAPREVDGKEAGDVNDALPPKPAASPPVQEFHGNQLKNKLVGSIARDGRSSLNVEDSVRGRYHAAVGRAVEKEWQLEVLRNRNYITPGVLTMSFLLDATGKIREIRVVEALQVGAIPKGFTLNAINGAKIPAMPADLKKQLDGEPLELTYRFTF